jgi:hypothetical protein
MAKMFYTLEEVCQKLDRNADEIRQMVRSGQIQEFRDRDRLMFKVEQIDLLASSDEDIADVHLDLEDASGGSGLALKDESAIGLADSRESSAMAESRDASGSSDSREGISLSDSREGTGVSVFDTDHGSDESEKTAAGEAATEEELGLDAVGSGSGLLDLTRESDDTSLGAELLEEVYASEGEVELPAHASGLFEAAAAERPVDEAPAVQSSAMPLLIEVYDSGWSGGGAGLLIGALASLIVVAVVAIVGVGGATPMLAEKIASSTASVLAWLGGLAGITAIFGLIGLFIGKASQ